MRSNDSIVYLLSLALILLGGISAWIRLPTVVGKRGERKVSWVLSNLAPSRYKVLNDVLIHTSKGSSQIDHIVFSKCGIFVIETKNLRGWIHGNETATTWTQTIYRSKYKFPNPIRQNMSHVQALRTLLNYPSHVPIHPVVVFSGSGELKNVYATSPVIYIFDLKKFIERTGKEVLSDEQVDELFGRVERSKIEGKKARKVHVLNLRTKVMKVREKVREGVCPRCGSGLVSRIGQYGKFLGCRNYPHCRFTSKIS